MTVIGQEAIAIYDSFKLTESEKTDLKVIKQRFNNYFTPKINKTYERLVFNRMMQKPHQSFDEFLTEAINQANRCAFGALRDEFICDKIVIGILDDDVRKSLLSEDDLLYDKAVSLCKAAELARKHLMGMKPNDTAEIDAIGRKNSTNRLSKKKFVKRQGTDRTFHCRRCGTEHTKRSCPAFQKTCSKCNKLNHFAQCCLSSKKVNTCNVNHDCSFESDPAYDLYVGSITKTDDLRDWNESVYFPGNHKVNFKLDSGAQCDIITSDEIKNCELHMQKSKVKSLISFSNDSTPVLGETKTKIKTKKGLEMSLKFLVVAPGHKCILGKESCERLGLIKRIASVHSDSNLFQGIGCIKKFVYDIDIVENPEFKIFHPRKIPFSIRDKVKLELDKMVENGIITPTTEPSPAVSPMVVVWKNNSPRVCIDLTDVNKNIKRRHFPLQTLDEVAARIHGSTRFSKLDCTKGFWQIRVTDRTSKYLTFATPWGRFRCLRLPFGLSSAPEIFQQIMCSLLQQIDGIEIAIDDVLIHAQNEEELNRRTKIVLDRIKGAGLKLNKEKCVFNVPRIKFLGHVISDKGIEADPEKINAINRLQVPKNEKELQRFLGMITYLCKFIKNYSDTTAPLRQLLLKDTEWEWGPAQDAAFEKLKTLIREAPVLRHYNPKEGVTLSVDASKHSVGAVLLQNNQPVAYSSKALTKSQLNYSQLEKEATAILVGCKKFHSYIWGNRSLVIETDHKPLEAIFKKPLHSAPARLQRIMFEIMPYSPSIQYKKGSELYVADALSRDCKNKEEKDDPPDITIHVTIPFSRTKLDEIEQALNEDSTMIQIKNFIMNGWPDSKKDLPEKLQQFFSFKEELGLYNGLIVRGNLLVIPQKIVPAVLLELHRGHKGVEGCLRLAKETVFWPKMSAEILNYVKSCPICQTVQKNKPMERITSSEVPSRPWQIVASDIFSFNQKEFLVIADEYSGFFDFVEVPSCTSASVIRHLKRWFSMFGIPDQINSDGGPQYSSQQFKQFVESWNIHHRVSSPEFARSNGLAERYCQEAKILLKKCHKEHSDVYLALLVHRNTPRKNIGSPAQRLMGRRTK
ncbi:unnamed protein product, partial [Nesidiocoris tenuis]